MGTEIKSNDFQTKVLGDINGTANKAYQEMLDKKAEYEAAKDQLSVFQQLREAAYNKFLSAQSNSNSKSDSSLLSAKAEYTSALSTFSEADMNIDILRGSLQDSIFYSGKMNNTAIIANSQLA